MLLGLEREEIAASAVREVVTLIRIYHGVDTNLPIPSIRDGLSPEEIGEIKPVVDPLASIPLEVPIGNLSSREIQRRFGVSRISFWRAKKNGGLLKVGYHFPRLVTEQVNKRGAYHQWMVMDLDTPRGRWDARRLIARRDGIWFEDNALWVRCGICGKDLWFGDATIDHIIPKSQGGSDKLEDLQLAHRECNKKKGDLLPVFLIAFEKAQKGRGVRM